MPAVEWRSLLLRTLVERSSALSRLQSDDVAVEWRKYNGRADVVFQPSQMSVDELLAEFRYATQRFYSLSSVAKRLRRSPVQIWWTLPLNLAYCLIGRSKLARFGRVVESPWS